MSNRSAWVIVLLVAVLAAGPGCSAARAEDPEHDPFAKEAAAAVRPEKPKGDPFAKEAGARARPEKPQGKAAAKAGPKSRRGKAAAMPKVQLRWGEKAVMQALAEPTTMEFVETPLDDVLAYVRNKHRIHVQLDRCALEDVGIGAEGPITFSMSGVPLHAALETMFRGLDITFTIRAGVLLITTPEEAESILMVRTYDVTDLLFPLGDQTYNGGRLPTTEGGPTSNLWDPGLIGGMGMGMGMGGMGGGTGTKGGTGGMGGGGGMFQITGPPYPASPYPANRSGADFDSLIDLITSTIVPTSWDQVGGPGSIAPFGTSLVIAQTLDVHRKIEALLEELRARQRGVPTVVIDARWLLLDSDSLERLVDDAPRGTGRLAVDPKLLDQLTRTVPGARGQVACISGTATYVVAGDRRSQVTSAIPVVGSGIGYQPVISIPNVGVLLQVRPVVDRGSRTAVLSLASTVTRWGDQPASVSVGGESPPAEIKEFGNENETSQVPAGSARATVDRPNIAAQQVASTLRVPLGQPVLVGGLTLDPTEKTAGQQPQGERKQLYLFVETGVVQPPRAARTESAPARGRAARRKR